MKWILLIATISFIIPTKRALHMFQQNRYETTRYTMWLQDFFKTNRKSVVIGVLTFVLAFLLGLINGFISGLLILFYSLTLIEKEVTKDYIKPLVVTARVIRQIIVMVILYALILTGVYFLGYNAAMYLMLLSPFLPYVLIYVMHLITSPIEALFRKMFKNSAKSILKSNKDLITIGITGSYGKTSSKNIINEILSEQFYTLPTPASFNTPMGITITIREQLKSTHEAFIVEMGADKVGDIVELSEFIEPKYAVITAIGPQHLSTFKKMDNIIKEKMSLVEMLPHDGVAVLNKDNVYINEYDVKNDVKCVSYGIMNTEVDYLATDLKYSIEGSSFTVKYQDESYDFKTRLLGEHNVLNILSGIALGRELGITWEKLQVAVRNVKFIEHRLELKTINGRTFIDNAFNSNPEGANMSLKVLSLMPQRRFIVTPGMIDLGEIQDDENYKFGYNMKDRVDIAVLVGVHQTKPIYKGLIESGFNESNIVVFDTVKEALAYVYQTSTVDDIILLENDLPDAFNN